jgi:hypothetical protein
MERVAVKNDALAKVDSKALLDRSEVLTVTPIQKGYSDYFADDDIAKVEMYQIDVLVRLGFRVLQGGIPSASSWQACRGLSGRFGVEYAIEAHIFVAFLAYCVQVTFKQQLKAHAPGLNVRQALDKLQAMQMLDVHFPTTDGRELIFTRYTEPESDQQLLLAKLGWTLPPQALRRSPLQI